MASIERLPRGEPESQGVSSRSILEFLRAADGGVDSFHGFMLLRRGVVVAEGAWKPNRLESPRMLFSLSKSFTSTAVGMAAAEGLLSVEDPVLSFFPRKAPKSPPPNLAAMRVRHLLSMNTGHEEDTTNRVMRTRDPVKAFLELPVEREPGTRFVYNSGASFMLSAIVQELTGRRVSDYLGPRLFKKLGIEGARWERHPCGIDFGGWGLSLRLEDIARFGQLYLQKGLWKGERILPEAWIDRASSRQSDNSGGNPAPVSDWQQGYGYQFWRCRHGAYRGDGAFGQLCLVMPEEEAVLVAVSGLSDFQAALDVVWEHLLPGMSPAALPPDPSGVEALRRFASGLELRPQAGAGASARGGSAGGGGSAPRVLRYRFEGNWAGLSELSFDFRDDALRLGYRLTRRKAEGNGLTGPLEPPRASGRRSLECGYGRWIDGISYLEGRGPAEAACSGAWTEPGVFTMRHFSRRTPFVTTIAFRFEGDRLRLIAKRNVGFGPADLEPPPIEGRARA
jgi:CubicO group peptidase (beta-lactamase class C family)